MKVLWSLLAIASVALIGTGALVLAFAWFPAIAPIATPRPEAFHRAVVARGESLAMIGNCEACHTAKGSQPYAGGLPLQTPFGTIHSTNITPDPDTGIGRWSRLAFRRAMYNGVSRDGHLLYPAFPYNHFPRANLYDLDALYAYFMTRAPVSSRPPANRLREPYGFRPLIGVWNLLYLNRGTLPPVPTESAEWNRGRELVEGLAHCGSCHTPRDGRGGERRRVAYDGAWVDGWYAPPLNSRSPAVQAWTYERLLTYLSTGLSPAHAAAAGPMGTVTRQLAQAPEYEVRAIAAYVAWLLEDAPAARAGRDAPVIDRHETADRDHPEAAVLFAGACAVCHAPGAPMMQEGRPPLAWGTPLHVATPHDTVRIILEGVSPPAGPYSPSMPAFGDMLSDRQIADISAYLRARFTDKPPWSDVQRATEQARQGATP